MSNVSTRPHDAATAVIAVVTAVTPPPRPPASPYANAAPKDNTDHLVDLLQQAETIASLLSHNFGGDGSFDEPSDAPGIADMVQCVASLLAAANVRAGMVRTADDARTAIQHASSLAGHLDAQSREDLPAGKRGFRLGDLYISMCYWTVEKLTKSAFDALANGEVQA